MKNNDTFITIFTPTYNRAYTLTRLYNSLLKQENKNFEWLIIDDGSKDNTKELVNGFIKEDKIIINYVYQENKGKYKAINKALDLAKGKLFMIVDSDDYLTNDAIDIIEKYYNQIKSDDNYIGVVGLKGKNEKEAHIGYFNEKKEKNKYYSLEYIDATYIEYRHKYKISGDRAEVCVTDKMRKYKFPEENDEKFMNEGYIWNQIGNDGHKFRYFNKIIYIAEYLEDGLSKNMKDIKKDSPQNAILEFNQYMDLKKLPLKVRIKACINYYRFCFFTKLSLCEAFKKCNSKMLSIISIPVACLYKVK